MSLSSQELRLKSKIRKNRHRSGSMAMSSGVRHQQQQKQDQGDTQSVHSSGGILVGIKINLQSKEPGINHDRDDRSSTNLVESVNADLANDLHTQTQDDQQMRKKQHSDMIILEASGQQKDVSSSIAPDEMREYVLCQQQQQQQEMMHQLNRNQSDHEDLSHMYPLLQGEQSSHPYLIAASDKSLLDHSSVSSKVEPNLRYMNNNGSSAKKKLSLSQVQNSAAKKSGDSSLLIQSPGIGQDFAAGRNYIYVGPAFESRGVNHAAAGGVASQVGKTPNKSSLTLYINQGMNSSNDMLSRQTEDQAMIAVHHNQQRIDINMNESQKNNNSRCLCQNNTVPNHETTNPSQVGTNDQHFTMVSPLQPTAQLLIANIPATQNMKKNNNQSQASDLSNAFLVVPNQARDEDIDTCPVHNRAQLAAVGPLENINEQADNTVNHYNAALPINITTNLAQHQHLVFTDRDNTSVKTGSQRNTQPLEQDPRTCSQNSSTDMVNNAGAEKQSQTPTGTAIGAKNTLLYIQTRAKSSTTTTQNHVRVGYLVPGSSQAVQAKQRLTPCGSVESELLRDSRREDQQTQRIGQQQQQPMAVTSTAAYIQVKKPVVLRNEQASSDYHMEEDYSEQNNTYHLRNSKQQASHMGLSLKSQPYSHSNISIVSHPCNTKTRSKHRQTNLAQQQQSGFKNGKNGVATQQLLQSSQLMVCNHRMTDEQVKIARAIATKNNSKSSSGVVVPQLKVSLGGLIPRKKLVAKNHQSNTNILTGKTKRESKSAANNRDSNFTRRRMKVPSVMPLESVTPAQDVLPETQADENLNEQPSTTQHETSSAMLTDQIVTQLPSGTQIQSRQAGIITNAPTVKASFFQNKSTLQSKHSSAHSSSTKIPKKGGPAILLQANTIQSDSQIMEALATLQESNKESNNAKETNKGDIDVGSSTFEAQPKYNSTLSGALGGADQQTGTDQGGEDYPDMMKERGKKAQAQPNLNRLMRGRQNPQSKNQDQQNRNTDLSNVSSSSAHTFKYRTATVLGSKNLANNANVTDAFEMKSIHQSNVNVKKSLLQSNNIRHYANKKSLASQFTVSDYPTRRPKTIPPAMHGYIKNHITRVGLVEVSQDELRQLQESSQENIKINQHHSKGFCMDKRRKSSQCLGTEESDQMVEPYGNENNDGEGYHRMDSGSQHMVSLQQMLDANGPYDQNTENTPHHSQRQMQAVHSYEAKNKKYYKRFNSVPRVDTSSSRSAANNQRGDTPQFNQQNLCFNGTQLHSTFPPSRESLAKQAAINNQDQLFDAEKSMTVTKLVPFSSQLTSGKQSIIGNIQNGNGVHYLLSQRHSASGESPKRTVIGVLNQTPEAATAGKQHLQGSNIKVTTEVFLSKVKMLSPESKNSRSSPHISAFNDRHNTSTGKGGGRSKQQSGGSKNNLTKSQNNNKSFEQKENTSSKAKIKQPKFTQEYLDEQQQQSMSLDQDQQLEQHKNLHLRRNNNPNKQQLDTAVLGSEISPLLQKLGSHLSSSKLNHEIGTKADNSKPTTSQSRFWSNKPVPESNGQLLKTANSKPQKDDLVDTESLQQEIVNISVKSLQNNGQMMQQVQQQSSNNNNNVRSVRPVSTKPNQQSSNHDQAQQSQQYLHLQQQQRNNRPSHSAVAKTRSSKATPVVVATSPEQQYQNSSYQQQLKANGVEDDKASRPAHTLKLDSSQSCIEELKFGAQNSEILPEITSHCDKSKSSLANDVTISQYKNGNSQKKQRTISPSDARPSPTLLNKQGSSNAKKKLRQTFKNGASNNHFAIDNSPLLKIKDDTESSASKQKQKGLSLKGRSSLDAMSDQERGGVGNITNKKLSMFNMLRVQSQDNSDLAHIDDQSMERSEIFLKRQMTAFDEGMSKQQLAANDATTNQARRLRPKKLDSIGKEQNSQCQSTLMNTVESPFLQKQKNRKLTSQAKTIIEITSKKRENNNTSSKVNTQNSSIDNDTRSKEQFLKIQASYRLTKLQTNQDDQDQVVQNNTQNSVAKDRYALRNYGNSRKAVDTPQMAVKQNARSATASKSRRGYTTGIKRKKYTYTHLKRQSVERFSSCESGPLDDYLVGHKLKQLERPKTQQTQAREDANNASAALKDQKIGMAVTTAVQADTPSVTSKPHNQVTITDQSNNFKEGGLSKDANNLLSTSKVNLEYSAFPGKQSQRVSHERRESLRENRHDADSQTTLEIESQKHMTGGNRLLTEEERRSHQNNQNQRTPHHHNYYTSTGWHSSVMKNDTTVGDGGSATSIVTGDYNENRSNNLLSRKQNTPADQNQNNNINSHPYRSNFLNRNERLKLQQRKNLHLQEQARQKTLLISRRNEPTMHEKDEIKQKQLMSRQAVKRDIKFACKRSTTHIRNKFQRQCDDRELGIVTLAPTIMSNQKKFATNAAAESGVPVPNIVDMLLARQTMHSGTHSSQNGGQTPIFLQEIIKGAATAHVIPTSHFYQNQNQNQNNQINSAGTYEAHNTDTQVTMAEVQPNNKPQIIEQPRDSLFNVNGSFDQNTINGSCAIYIEKNQHFSTERLRDESKSINTTNHNNNSSSAYGNNNNIGGANGAKAAMALNTEAQNSVNVSQRNHQQELAMQAIISLKSVLSESSEIRLGLGALGSQSIQQNANSGSPSVQMQQQQQLKSIQNNEAYMGMSKGHSSSQKVTIVPPKANQIDLDRLSLEFGDSKKATMSKMSNWTPAELNTQGSFGLNNVKLLADINTRIEPPMTAKQGHQRYSKNRATSLIQLHGVVQTVKQGSRYSGMLKMGKRGKDYRNHLYVHASSISQVKKPHSFLRSSNSLDFACERN